MGKRIDHTFYGEGKIISFDNGTVKIEFFDGVTRKFSVKSCIEKGLLRILEDKDETIIDKPEVTDNIEVTSIQNGEIQECKDVLDEKSDVTDSQILFKYIVAAVIAVVVGIILLAFTNNPIANRIIGFVLIAIGIIVLVVGFSHLRKTRKVYQKDTENAKQK